MVNAGIIEFATSTIILIASLFVAFEGIEEGSDDLNIDFRRIIEKRHSGKPKKRKKR